MLKSDFTAIQNMLDLGSTSEAQRAEFAATLAGIERRLGRYTSTVDAGYQVRITTRGRFVTMRYMTTFERGGGQETFVVRTDRDPAVLTGYNISARAFLRDGPAMEMARGSL